MSPENLAGDIKYVLKCFTLRYSPCFLKHTLELISVYLSL